MQRETRPEKKTTLSIVGEDDIEAEIATLKADSDRQLAAGISLATKSQEDSYRATRLQQRQDAITKARELEDRP